MLQRKSQKRWDQYRARTSNYTCSPLEHCLATEHQPNPSLRKSLLSSVNRKELSAIVKTTINTFVIFIAEESGWKWWYYDLVRPRKEEYFGPFLCTPRQSLGQDGGEASVFLPEDPPRRLQHCVGLFRTIWCPQYLWGCLQGALQTREELEAEVRLAVSFTNSWCPPKTLHLALGLDKGT